MSPNPGIIDLHLHLLPGLDDDEPSSLDESFEFALAVSKMGITHAVATPHQLKYGRLPDGALRGQVAELNMRLRHAGASLTIWPGSEIALTDNALGEILAGSFSPLGGEGGRFLIEIGEHCTLEYAGAAVEELSSEGLTPVIAHPERSLFWPECPDACEMLVEFGAEIQITACGITGYHGGEFTRRSAIELLRRGLVHYVASDAHSLTDGKVDAFVNIRDEVLRYAGSAATRRILIENPARLLGLESEPSQ